MLINPKLTAAEWAAIRRVLPASGGVGRPRHGDREAIAVLLYSQTQQGRFGVPLQGLVPRKVAAALVVKRARWKEAGVWPLILEAGRPAMRRLKEKELRASMSDKSDIAILMRSLP